ncbi:uncharacterized protein LOC116925828 [Daphnia magna]|uniref:Uncharacterized protein n=2 Tax=Daphnia magna TaxID=35525 RepID=A0ABQ9YY06_9CRUS|nr:uncharacterized protein LOC116925828 [Daphnia magna]KAK4005536.1 hypothetical protein OUZ56_007241 [Daphnia magna]KZS03728.1 Uncharacterized protein APZ42_033478 [Daphnia magna]
MAIVVYLTILSLTCLSGLVNGELSSCQGAGLKYLNGDALSGLTSCLGPENTPYPTSAIERMFKSDRRGRASRLVDPAETQKTLLKFHEAANYGHDSSQLLQRQARNVFDLPQSQQRAGPTGCSTPGGRLCKTRYNTTAPLYGVSLTSGQPVTIVQKFPDLLQQVIFEVCDSAECDVVHGECVQTYVPYLFLVIPLGPVTLTGQDYVLVENGCVCRPKYARPIGLQESSLSEVLPGLN